MVKHVMFIAENKHDKLLEDGFHTQKLFADDVLYYIRDIKGGVVDQSLFLRGDDGWLKDFIQLDFSSLTMAQSFAEKDGFYRADLEWIAGINIEQLRNDACPLASLVESIQAGLLDGDISPSISTNDNMENETVFLGYNVRTGKVTRLPVWRPESKDYTAPNQALLESVKFYSEIPKEFIRLWIPKYHFDWLFNKTKSGEIVVTHKS
ncbi:hypothetical protein ACTG16_22315 [Aeromonas sp. 23P]|uniref:hypothetical protein n=1 Tax=Aeromonas sp. 23P TaxID=3452716 RepID=UPI003F7AD170|nr:hypothetical protein [Aeromonas veronii]